MSLSNVTALPDLLDNAQSLMAKALNQLNAAEEAEKNGARDGEMLRKIAVAKTVLETAQLWASKVRSDHTWRMVRT